MMGRDPLLGFQGDPLHQGPDWVRRYRQTEGQGSSQRAIELQRSQAWGEGLLPHASGRFLESSCACGALDRPGQLDDGSALRRSQGSRATAPSICWALTLSQAQLRASDAVFHLLLGGGTLTVPIL